MSTLVTQVAKVLSDSFEDRISRAAALPFSETGVATPSVLIWEDYARAAIKATLEHLRDNVSEEMVSSGKIADSLAAGFGEDWGTRVGDVIRGAINAALQEVEGA